jgi:hypothetical protein
MLTERARGCRIDPLTVFSLVGPRASLPSMPPGPTRTPAGALPPELSVRPTRGPIA